MNSFYFILESGLRGTFAGVAADMEEDDARQALATVFLSPVKYLIRKGEIASSGFPSIDPVELRFPGGEQFRGGLATHGPDQEPLLLLTHLVESWEAPGEND